ncbi:MAG TPA: ATP synthase F1 subunit gamma [Fibrobacteraceae bacterium]|nr:ATP synthase F1 subunit gamma [Fibrobacteraceae bacterium]
MPSIKELRQKIRSLRSTSKITSALKLVSSAKLRKAQEAFSRNNVYFGGMQEVVTHLLGSPGASSLALLKPAVEVKRIRVVVLSTDMGLCGAFNLNLFKLIQGKVRKEWAGKLVDVVTVGRKGADFFTRRCPVSDVDVIPGLPTKIPYEAAHKIGAAAIVDFLAHKVDEVYLGFNLFHSMVSQEARLEPLLPIVPLKPGHGATLDYIYEPEEEGIYERVLPLLVHSSIYRAMLSNRLGELAARMNAMDNATRNSKDLINRYTLIMNRARQTAITTELTEIVSGAESLKG